MKDEELSPDPEFIKGFNEGYLLRKYLPDLSTKLEAALPETERGLGFKEGKAQLEYELEYEQRPKWMQRYAKDDLTIGEGDPEKTIDKGDISMDKEDIPDPEIE